jgi:hypothetical protein
MTTLPDEEQVVVRALRQAFESEAAGPGAALNPHPNAFFATLSGAFDLLKTAKRVLANLDAYRAMKQAQAQKEAALAAEKAAKTAEQTADTTLAGGGAPPTSV